MGSAVRSEILALAASWTLYPMHAPFQNRGRPAAKHCEELCPDGGAVVVLLQNACAFSETNDAPAAIDAIEKRPTKNLARRERPLLSARASRFANLELL